MTMGGEEKGQTFLISRINMFKRRNQNIISVPPIPHMRTSRAGIDERQASRADSPTLIT